MNVEDIFKQKNLELGVILKKVLRRWYWFAFSTVVLLIGAYYVNKVSNNSYKNKTTILLSSNNNNSSSSFLRSSDFLQGMSMFAPQANIENEMQLLSSFSLIQESLEKLEQHVTYHTYEYPLPVRFKDPEFLSKRIELYNDTPIRIVFDKTFDQLLNLTFEVEILNEEEYRLKASQEFTPIYNYIADKYMGRVVNISIDQKLKFNTQIQHKNFKFSITLDKEKYASFKQEKVYFTFHNLKHRAMLYKSQMAVVPTSQKSTLLVISMEGPNYQLVTDFLNTLANQYLENNIDKKNKVALNTVNFIDGQIEKVHDSLSETEQTLKSFKSSNSIMDLGFQAQQLYEKLELLETEKITLTSQKRYYTYIKDYFTSNADVSDLLAPSSMNVVDPLLSNLTNELITANAQRNTYLSQSNSEKNLYVNNLDKQIKNIKNTIFENVENNLKTTGISLNEVNTRLNQVSAQLSNLPKTELRLMGIERKFNLNDAIYTYLLQKRSEAQIALASNTPDYEIVDPARYLFNNPTKPRKKLNYLLAIFLGLFFPMSIIAAKEFFNDKIRELEDIEQISGKPVLGHIFHSPSKVINVLSTQPNTPIAESLRAVRTNYSFFTRNNDSQVLLFTSSMSGEGKTFCALNMAQAFALNGKRAILLEFDLRRPKLHQALKVPNLIGLSSYLINQSTIDDIIQRTAIENVDIITAGHTPPNPAEIIDSARTNDLIESLKEMYDYVIIDSAPVGVVSETFMIMQYANLNIFVARQNYTGKGPLHSSIRKINANKIENVVMLLNDVDPKVSSTYYGYDSKYYASNSKKERKRRKKV